MQIQCPACGTQAQIPGSKEGAKVRCPSCSKVFVARAPGRAGRRSPRTFDPTRYLIAGGALLALVVLYFAFRSARGDAPRPSVQAEGAEPSRDARVDMAGWESAPVVLVRRVHELLAAGEPLAALPHVDAALAWEEGGRGAGGGDWRSLTLAEQERFAGDLCVALAADELLREWEPYACAGEGGAGVVERSGGRAIVRLVLKNRTDPGLPDRHFEWRLVERGPEWKVVGGERWFSAAELEAIERAGRRKTETVTLSDGRKVIEGAIRPIPHMPETPPDVRQRIEAHVATLIDLSTPGKEVSIAREDLEAIGKPAIPYLLTQLAVIPLTNETQAIQLNMICDMLYRLTGYVTTYQPHESLGAGDEHRQSGLKQWFGWYDRRFAGFVRKQESEAVLEPISPEEQRQLEEEQRRKEMAERIGLGKGGDD